MDDAFQRYMGELTDAKIQFEDILAQFRLESFYENKGRRPNEKRRTSVEERIEETQKKMKETRKILAQNTLPYEAHEHFSEALEMLWQHNEILQNELLFQVPVESEKINGQAIEDIIVTISEDWFNLSNAEKREFLSTYVDSIVIFQCDNYIEIYRVKFKRGKTQEATKENVKQKRLS